MITSEKEKRSFMEATTHQTVIVTGGATGLGYAIAEQFLRRGANVFLNGRTEAKLAAAADRRRRVTPGTGYSPLEHNLERNQKAQEELR
jgi:NAD(P)-dependent dehydrogenase (short-subunit alcohol dehydrogenase family)